MSADAYYCFFPGDYGRDTADLSLMEHGAYRVLLDAYYADGGLPGDRERLVRICRANTPEEKAAVDFVVKRFFRIEDGKLINKRAEREIAARAAYKKAKSDAGKASAAARTEKGGTAIPPGASNDPRRAAAEQKSEQTPEQTPEQRSEPPSPSPSPSRTRSKTPPSQEHEGGSRVPSEARRLREDHEYPEASLRLYCAWTECFGEASGKDRLEVLRSLTALQRLGYVEDDIKDVIDYYASRSGNPPGRDMSPVEFFQPEAFRAIAEAAGIEWIP